MNTQELQKSLGFSEEDKARWVEINAKYYGDIESAWVEKLMMHAYPKRAPSVYVMPSYQSPVTGQWIDSPNQRREDMKRSGSRPWEGMESETKYAQSRAKAEEKAADVAIENAVVAAWQQLPSEKRKVLEVSG